jgi:Protein of unknown function (DUF3043)
MPVFRRKSAGATDGTTQDSPGAQSPDSPADTRTRPAAQAGKGRPTPKRREAEAGRYTPIGGAKRTSSGPRTPEQKARDKTERQRSYAAMRRGEEWALPAKDKGPARALARDLVDSKRRISEYYMYILLALLVVLFGLGREKAVQTYLDLVLLVLVVVLAADAFSLRRALRRLMAERLPDVSSAGLTRYAVFRAIQIRRFRLPPPRVRPGEEI